MDAGCALGEAVASKRRRSDSTEASREGMRTVCAVGATGAGKGSTLNSCFRSTSFSVGHMLTSDTTRPVSMVLPWRATGCLMRGVDLCGFSDSEGRDTGFIESMVSYLRKEVMYVHCFLLLFNSQEARIGVHLKDMLLAIKAVFGTLFMSNVMIGFTRWEYTKRAKLMRRGLTEEALAANINALLKDLLGHDHDCPCVFIDNSINMFSAAELQDIYGEELSTVTAACDQTFESIRHFASSNKAFVCTGIESTLAERDVGRQMILREECSRTAGADAVNALVQSWTALEIMEPETLAAKMEELAIAQRDSLDQLLAAKTMPDLEHVRTSVLASFDARMHEEMKKARFKNNEAACSKNRRLRKKLLENFVAFAADMLHQQSLKQHEVFDNIRRKDRELIQQYLESCNGGHLAWQPFKVLQEQLRLEQFLARDRIFGEDCEPGRLPEIREFLGDPQHLASFVGKCRAPEWVQKLAGKTL